METVTRTQTAFRLKDTLLEKLKWRARKADKSLNSFVEEALEEIIGSEFPKLSESFFEENRSKAEALVLKECRLPIEYEGLDAFGQAAMDKKLAKEALYGDKF